MLELFVTKYIQCNVMDYGQLKDEKCKNSSSDMDNNGNSTKQPRWKSYKIRQLLRKNLPNRPFAEIFSFILASCNEYFFFKNWKCLKKDGIIF